jgi:hypothetical protein
MARFVFQIVQSALVVLIFLNSIPAFSGEMEDANRHHLTPFTWEGHKVRGDAGTFSAFDQPLRVGGMLELGYEYGWVFGKSFYLGFDVTWNLFFPDSFKPQNITLNPNTNGSPAPSWLVIAIPIIHSHFGYVFQSTQTLVTLGSAYVWGITSTVRQPIKDNLFVEAKWLWWLDRVLGDQGIHDMYFTVGGGIKF